MPTIRTVKIVVVCFLLFGFIFIIFLENFNSSKLKKQFLAKIESSSIELKVPFNREFKLYDAFPFLVIGLKSFGKKDETLCFFGKLFIDGNFQGLGVAVSEKKNFKFDQKYHGPLYFPSFASPSEINKYFPRGVIKLKTELFGVDLKLLDRNYENNRDLKGRPIYKSLIFKMHVFKLSPKNKYSDYKNVALMF